MPPPLRSRRTEETLRQAAKLEREGNLEGALLIYQSAAAADPDNPDTLALIAQLAGRMAMHETAAKLWSRVRGLEPARLEAVDGHARALREIGRFDEAVDILRASLLDHPEDARLWNTLAVTLVQSGQTDQSLTFFDEAVRLDPRSVTAIYNRAGAYLDLARLEEAQAEFARARRLARAPKDAAMIDFAVSTARLTQGDLEQGWDDYEARNAPDLPQAPAFDVPGVRWTPATPLAGRSLLVVAEQGLGDELMFANVLPDVLVDLGPTGSLTVAVEPRLVKLFARSFPDAKVVAHATDLHRGRRRRTAPGVGRIDYWAPLASLMRRFRRSAGAFPTSGGYLRADPDRVAHWRSWLGEGAPAVGITWRSGDMLGERHRMYPPLDAWADLLKVAGVRFVNLQYGECAKELAQLSTLSGVEILQAPGLNIREDIDDLAALCGALDLVVSVGNATGALAGSTGAPLLLIDGPNTWPRLGADRSPWYPQARVLIAPSYGDWAPVMQAAKAIVEALGSTRPR